MNFNKEMVINKNLTVDNLRAIIGMEAQKEVTIGVFNCETRRSKELVGNATIQNILQEQDTIIVKETKMKSDPVVE